MRLLVLAMAVGQLLATEMTADQSSVVMSLMQFNHAKGKTVDKCNNKCLKPNMHCRLDKKGMANKFACACNRGYFMNKTFSKCLKNKCFGKCKGKMMTCVQNARTKNMPGGYSCVCAWGYNPDKAGLHCVQDRHCVGKCKKPNMICLQDKGKPAGYRCQCYSGFTWNGSACTKHPACRGRCKNGNMVCVVNKLAKNGHVCKCWSGFRWKDDEKLFCIGDPCHGKCKGPKHVGEICMEDMARPQKYRCECKQKGHYIPAGTCTRTKRCGTGMVTIGGKCYKHPSRCRAWNFKHHGKKDPGYYDYRGPEYDPTKDKDRWGSWAAWGACSRSCGDGVQFRRRKCYGTCTGPSKSYKRCYVRSCPALVKRPKLDPIEWSRLNAQCSKMCNKPNMHCRINGGSNKEKWSCVCNKGWVENSKNVCVPHRCYGKCAGSNQICVENKKTANLPGGYQCRCMWGYQWKDKKYNTHCVRATVCKGRCKGKAQICQQVKYKKSGYRCKCWTGYEWQKDSNGRLTGDCTRAKACMGKCGRGHMICIPNPKLKAGYRCQCWTGFRWKEDTHDTCIGDVCFHKCVGKDHPNEKCTEDRNFISGFRCECKKGSFRPRGGKYCVPNICKKACTGKNAICLPDKTAKAGFKCVRCKKHEIAINGVCYNHPKLCIMWRK